MTVATPTPAETPAQAALQTAEAMAPAVLKAVAVSGAVVSPQVALALQLAPIALQFLQSAQQLATAGALTPAQLASMWQQVGSGVQTAHNAWVAAGNAAPAVA